MSILKTIIQLRRDTEANWLINKNVIPAAGEPCLTTDGIHAGQVKYGDGVTTWENLPYSGVIGDDKTIEVVDGAVRIKGSDTAAAGQTFRINADGTGIEWYSPADAGTVDIIQKDVEEVQQSVEQVTGEVASLKEIVDTKANAEDVYTKDEVKSLVSTAFDYKGVVATKADLDAIDAPESGDVYQVTDEGGFYVFDGDSWEDFGMPVDLSGYVTKDMLSDVEGNMDAMQETIDAIPSLYMSKDECKKFSTIDYEIFSKPYGTLVSYTEDEIRVMCPADTQWVKQSVGSTGNANMYYMGFKAYAPEGAVSFKEDTAKVISDQTMYKFVDNDFAGTDKYGRNYSIVWLALASYDEVSDTWSYFGKNSTEGKYIGWDYSVEWYDADGIMIASDCIRINLSNEECHMSDGVNVNRLVQTTGDVLILDGGDSDF